MKVSVVTAKQANAEAFVVGVMQKEDERTAPSLATIGVADHVHANFLLGNKASNLGVGGVVSVPADEINAALVLVGLGDPTKLTQEKLGEIFNNALGHVKGIGFQKVATTLLDDAPIEGAEQALVQGAICGQLSFDQYRSKPNGKKQPKSDITAIQLIGKAKSRKPVKDATIIAQAVNDARLLANLPANLGTPKKLASEARARGKKHGFTVTVKGRAALRKEGFNALCGVAQGSYNEEQLITMDYHPTGAKKTIVIVGKGVTFDTGGISLKPGNMMWEMKYDKCGACNVIAMMATLKDLGVKHRVVGIVPAVENMPGGKAQRPGDIVTAKDGTTIEVLNTDAEGRLILADAITYGRTFKPDWMADMATLTGACEFAVGKTYVAIMSKDDALADKFVAASIKAGDKGWKLPQGEEFDEGNKGTYADLQNISLNVKAGTSIGGSFVSHFAKDTPFVHLDIASKAWVKKQDYFGNGPTGAGLRVCLQAIRDA